MKGTPFSVVQFCKYTKTFLAEAGTRTRDRWASPKPIEACTKKWYIPGGLCGLTKKIEKKLATVIVGHFSQEKR